ncbi:hypothetical protein Syun_025280 [Stephania yunnanensis]|uniref:Uncharacterized protein n=1 Tax=Stephania yunnanensis TaxID=152371 RepID=A0AAP0HW33_9MAGN
MPPLSFICIARRRHRHRGSLRRCALSSSTAARLSPFATSPASRTPTPSARASLRRCSPHPPPLLASSAAAAPFFRRRYPPFPSPLLAPASSAAATRIILDSAAGLFIRDSATRTPTPPSTELHPGGLARRHNRLMECLATRWWTFEAQSQPRKAAIRYTGNIYLIAKKRITPIYLTEEVFEHYKRMRATDEAFKKKSEQMSTNRKSKVGRPGTGISLHSAGSIFVRQSGDMLDRLARMEALLMQHLGIRPHVPPTSRAPLLLVTEYSGPQSDDQPGHLTTDIALSQSAHLDDHQPRHWTDPHRRMPEDRHHLLDDHNEFMSQLMPPPRPPPRQ